MSHDLMCECEDCGRPEDNETPIRVYRVGSSGWSRIHDRLYEALMEVRALAGRGASVSLTTETMAVGRYVAAKAYEQSSERAVIERSLRSVTRATGARS